MRYYVNIPEGQVHYQEKGTGQPLLLLHQTRMSSEEYSEVMPILARTNRVIAVDLLGHGNSDDPPPGFRIEDHAQALIHFLDALDIKEANVVGHHVGARIAVELAASWPERVCKLVLSGCPWHSKEERIRLQSDAKYHKWDSEITEDGLFLAKLWQASKSLWGSDVNPKALCKILGLSLSTIVRPYNIHDAVFQHDIDSRLRMIKSPTLLVSGSEDPFYDKLEVVSKLIPQCQVKVIEGGGGYICLERPKDFAEAIIDFLKDPKL